MKNKVIISSILTIALCFSLIAGSTFALFSSESTVNIAVTAGDIDLTASIDESTLSTSSFGVKQADGKFANGGAATLSGDTLTLGLMTPGDEASFKINVVNKSNISIKYRVKWSISGDLASGLVATANGSNIVNDKSAWTDLAPVTDPDGVTLETIDVVVSLPSTAGNDYQGKSASINFVVEAVQGNYIPATEVNASTSTYENISNLIANGESIRFTEDVTLDNGVGGYTYITTNEDINFYLDDGVELAFSETTLINGTGSITVHGGTLATDYELCVTGDSTLVINGGEHHLHCFSATGNGTIIINDGTLHCYGDYASTGGGINLSETGKLLINGGVFHMYQPFNLNANRCDSAYIEINGGTINLVTTCDKLFAVRNVMDKDVTSGVSRGSSIKITGGEFYATYPEDDTGDATAFIRNEDGPTDTNKVLVSPSEDNYNCAITGGTFYGNWCRTGESSANTRVENTIIGFVADGYIMTGNQTDGYVVTAE